MLRVFLSLDAIKTSCGSKVPPLPHPRLCTGRKQIKTALEAGTRPDSRTSDLELCPKWAPNIPYLFVLVRAQGTKGRLLLILGAEDDKVTKDVYDFNPASRYFPISWGRQMGT